MGIKWDAKKRTYVYTKPKPKVKRPKNFDYDKAFQNKRAQIEKQLSLQTAPLFQLAEKVADILSKKETEEFAEEVRKAKIEKRKESKKKAREIADLLKGIQQSTSSPIQKAISSSKKMAKNRYKFEEKNVDSKLGGLSNTIYAGAEIVESALNFATQGAKFAYNRYTTLQEDYMTAQGIANAQNIAARVKKAGSSIVNGIATGAATGGAVGAVIGGVTAAIDFGVNQYFEYQQRMSSYYQQLNATNFQTNFDASRLGLIGSSGTEN